MVDLAWRAAFCQRRLRKASWEKGHVGRVALPRFCQLPANLDSPFLSPPKAALSDTESGVQLSSSGRTGDTSDGSLRGLSGPRTPTPPRHSSPGRGRSPRRGLSPACSDSSTLTLIHSALHKRQLQVQVLTGLSVPQPGTLGAGLGP